MRQTTDTVSECGSWINLHHQYSAKQLQMMVAHANDYLETIMCKKKLQG